MGESALFGEGKEYYLNLKIYNDRPGSLNKDHVDIFEVPYLFDLIHNILKKDVALPEYFTLSSPGVSSYTVLKMRSPVSIDIYDEDGLHTGLVKGEEADEVEMNIPNSLYLEFMDDKYIVVPTEGNYKLKLKGFSSGIFTLEEEITDEEEGNRTILFKDIPTSSNLLGEVDIMSGILASSISLDEDGDNVFEKTIYPTDPNILDEESDKEKVEKSKVSSGSYPVNILAQALNTTDNKDNKIEISKIINKTDLIKNEDQRGDLASLPQEFKESLVENNTNILNEGNSLLASAGFIKNLDLGNFKILIVSVGCFILLLVGLELIFKVL